MHHAAVSSWPEKLMTEAGSTRALLLSAIASGQGKTTVTAALARKLRQQGQRVRVFKTGPDFLDPMILERASGHPVYTLDLWMVGTEQCRLQLAQAAAQADVILIEGVMGLYDGAPSSADLARVFGIPVVAVLDASAMAQTAGALVSGLRDYGPVVMAGLIANRVGNSGHAGMIAAAMRAVPLLATLPEQRRSLPERHLGLLAPDEVDDIDSLLDCLADDLVLNADVWRGMEPVQFPVPDAPLTIPPLLSGKTIAIARDAAFAFIYPANLDCLRTLGANTVFFSPLANEPVPECANAVYLPGGYPELHASVLAQAYRWQDSIRAAYTQRLPIVAECGGMMVLAESLIDQHGAVWPMAGLLPGRVVMQIRLAAIGWQGWLTSCGELRGHAFHYSRFETRLAAHARTRQHPSGDHGEAIYRHGSITASYFHAYFPACAEAVARLFLGSDSL